MSATYMKPVSGKESAVYINSTQVTEDSECIQNPRNKKNLNSSGACESIESNRDANASQLYEQLNLDLRSQEDNSENLRTSTFHVSNAEIVIKRSKFIAAVLIIAILVSGLVVGAYFLGHYNNGEGLIVENKDGIRPINSTMLKTLDQGNTSSGSTTTLICEDGWVPGPAQIGSCYKFILSPTKNWEEALNTCIKLGGYLATLETAEEIIWVKGYRSYYSNLDVDFWVGGYWDGNLWHWIRATPRSPMSVFDWAPGQPDSPGRQNCIKLFGKQYDFEFDDETCGRALSLICEMELY